MTENKPAVATHAADSSLLEKKLQARALLIKSRVYRFFALVFALVGIAVFIVLYLKNIEGQFFQSLQSPMTIIILLFPFLPAAVLSWLAHRQEKLFIALMNSSLSGQGKSK